MAVDYPFLFKRTKEMLYGLYTIFFFGMFLNLFSGDDDPAKKPWYAHVALVIHTLIAVALLIGSFVILRICLKNRHESWSKLGIYGFASMVISMVGGVLTMVLKDLGGELSSYLMAIGFMSATASYGFLIYQIGIQKYSQNHK